VEEGHNVDVGIERQELVTLTTTTPNYESDNGFADFPDDIEFVLRNDPEYLELLRTRLDLSNDGSNCSSGDDHERNELVYGEHSHSHEGKNENTSWKYFTQLIRNFMTNTFRFWVLKAFDWTLDS
jgi:hypothetical protein